MGRPATWGTSSAPSAVAARDSASSSAPQVGVGVDLEHGEGDRAADGRRQPAHPLDLALGSSTSSPADPAGASSKIPVPSSPRAAPIPNSSSSAAKVPGTGSPSMARWAIVREVEKPRAPADQGLLDDGLHGGDLVGCGRLVAGTPLAHHVGPDCPVGHLGADVDGPSPLRQGVEVLGEGLPVPLDALAQGRPGNVLYPLHQPDQPLVTVGRRAGAKPTPVLPITRVVTPCQAEGARTSSQVAWPS